MDKISRVVSRIIATFAVVVGILNIIDAIYAGILVDAATSSLAMAAVIEPSMTMTLSDSSKTLSITPSSNGTFGAASVTVGAYSNGSIGYNLTMSASSTSLTGTNTGSTISTLAANSTCNGGSACTSSNFTVGRWGVAIDNAVYGPASTSTLSLVNVDGSSTSVAANTKTIYLGANLDLSVPIDTYTNTINFTATPTVAAQTVTFTFDSNIDNLIIKDSMGTTKATINASGNTASLDFANTYTIIPTYNTGYGPNTATLTGSGFLNDDTLTYTVGAGASTVALTSGIAYMQNMSTTTLAILMPNTNNEATLTDNRDGKTYTVAKLADGNYWMTQNLDLCIGCTGTASLTSDNTDLSTTASGSGIYTDGYSVTNGVYTWTPASTAVTSNHTISGTTVSSAFDNSAAGNNVPYSAEGGATYVYTSDSSSDDTTYTSLSQCTDAGHTAADCAHYHVGNYYNWGAAVASNDLSGLVGQYTMADNSICPAGWRLPVAIDSTNTISEFGDLLTYYSIIDTNSSNSYLDNGFNLMRSTPLFFVRGGNVDGETLNGGAGYGYYWSSVAYNSYNAYNLTFNSLNVNSAFYYYWHHGFSVRCVAR